MPLLTNPRQTVLVSCRSHVDLMGRLVVKDNLIAVDWHTPLSFKPLLYAISIGKETFSHGMIEKSKSFVVNFMLFSEKDAVLYCGRNSGKHFDKFKESGLTKEEADSIDCPRVKEAVAFVECELIQSIDSGDHTLFIGKVANSDVKGDGKRVFHLDKNEFTTTKD